MPITVPDGSAVFLDANIFVYHFSGPTTYTAPCTQLLQRIENGGLSGFTSTLVLGACPTLTFLLRLTMRRHLLRSRPRKILNVFQ